METIHLSSHRYKDYEKYCKIRNSVTKAVMLKGLATSIKTSPKSFWSHAKEETKSKNTIGDLGDKDGELKTKDQEKANMLNDFFSLQLKGILFCLILNRK